MLNLKYDKYEELVKEVYKVVPRVVPITHETIKGQLISKSLLGVFNFLQKTNENKSHSSKIEFDRSFFGGNVGLRKSFRFCLTFR